MSMQNEYVAVLTGDKDKFKEVSEILHNASLDGGCSTIEDFLCDYDINIPQDLLDADCHYLGIAGLLLLEEDDFKYIYKMSRYHFICDSRVEDNGNLGISFYGPSPDDDFWEFVSRKSKYVRNISIR